MLEVDADVGRLTRPKTAAFLASIRFENRPELTCHTVDLQEEKPRQLAAADARLLDTGDMLSWEASMQHLISSEAEARAVRILEAPQSCRPYPQPCKLCNPEHLFQIIFKC